MATPITIPRLGWNMEEGVFLGWLKPNGAPVRAGEPLFTLESDKSTEDIECLENGVLHLSPDGPREGDRLPVGAVIGYIVQAGETVSLDQPVPVAPQVLMAHETEASPPRPRPAKSSQPTISPRALRVARELGIDWTTLSGSGSTGRIRERDVRAARKPETRRSKLRRTIAEHMVASRQATAPVTLMSTGDATNLVQWRDHFKKAAPGDVVPSSTDLFVKLAADALVKHPQLNARWSEHGVVASDGIHIGIAVDTDDGLLVPVVRDVPSLTVHELAKKSRDLVERARQGKLKSSEMQGGTFSVTNLGSFGIDAFTPIIHLPQCAILGIGRIRREPVAKGDKLVIRERVTLSLTFDHRIVDGALAARFLQTLIGLLEDPAACFA